MGMTTIKWFFLSVAFCKLGYIWPTMVAIHTVLAQNDFLYFFFENSTPPTLGYSSLAPWGLRRTIIIISHQSLPKEDLQPKPGCSGPSWALWHYGSRKETFWRYLRLSYLVARRNPGCNVRWDLCAKRNRQIEMSNGEKKRMSNIIWDHELTIPEDKTILRCPAFWVSVFPIYVS